MKIFSSVPKSHVDAFGFVCERNGLYGCWTDASAVVSFPHDMGQPVFRVDELVTVVRVRCSEASVLISSKTDPVATFPFIHMMTS